MEWLSSPCLRTGSSRWIKVLKVDGSELLHAYIPLRFKAGDALQFDWSEEHVILGGVDQKIKVAHFRLCHSRKSFIVAYPGEPQEMVLDAFAPLPGRRMHAFAEKGPYHFMAGCQVG